MGRGRQPGPCAQGGLEPSPPGEGGEHPGPGSRSLGAGPGAGPGRRSPRGRVGPAWWQPEPERPTRRMGPCSGDAGWVWVPTLGGQTEAPTGATSPQLQQTLLLGYQPVMAPQNCTGQSRQALCTLRAQQGTLRYIQVALRAHSGDSWGSHRDILRACSGT